MSLLRTQGGKLHLILSLSFLPKIALDITSQFWETPAVEGSPLDRLAFIWEKTIMLKLLLVFAKVVTSWCKPFPVNPGSSLGALGSLLMQPSVKQQSVTFLAILVVCTSVGCHGIYSDNPNVENAFRKDATFDWMSTVRRKDDNASTFGYSNKARTVEQHLLGSE